MIRTSFSSNPWWISEHCICWSKHHKTLVLETQNELNGWLSFPNMIGVHPSPFGQFSKSDLTPRKLQGFTPNMVVHNRTPWVSILSHGHPWLGWLWMIWGYHYFRKAPYSDDFSQVGEQSTSPVRHWNKWELSPFATLISGNSQCHLQNRPVITIL